MKIILREDKIMNGVRHVITVYRKSGSLLAQAFNTEKYEAHHLILSEDMKPDQILSTIEFFDGVLVLDD